LGHTPSLAKGGFAAVRECCLSTDSCVLRRRGRRVGAPRDATEARTDRGAQTRLISERRATAAVRLDCGRCLIARPRAPLVRW
jgi:hypothetical protein